MLRSREFPPSRCANAKSGVTFQGFPRKSLNPDLNVAAVTGSCARRHCAKLPLNLKWSGQQTSCLTSEEIMLFVAGKILSSPNPLQFRCTGVMQEQRAG